MQFVMMTAFLKLFAAVVGVPRDPLFAAFDGMLVLGGSGGYTNGCPSGSFSIGISHGSALGTSGLCSYYGFDPEKEPACDGSQCTCTPIWKWMCQFVNPDNIKLNQSAFDLFKSTGATANIQGMGAVRKTFGHGLMPLSDLSVSRTTGCGQCYLIKSADTFSSDTACGPCCGQVTCSQTYPVYILLMAVDNVDPIEYTSPEIGVTEFVLGPPSYDPAGCGDSTDGKWPFEFKPYTDTAIGCM